MLRLTWLVLAISLAAPTVHSDEGIWDNQSYQTENSQDLMQNQTPDTGDDWAAPDARPRPRPRPPRRPPNRERPWYFLGCTNTDFDCSWAAFRYGFREYRTDFDIRCRRAFYACYAR